MASHTIPFTERAINAALKKYPSPVIFKDDLIIGLRLIVEPDKKIYYLKKKIHRKDLTLRIDDFSIISPSIARDKAKKLIDKLKDGIDPKEERKLEQARDDILNLSIQQAIDDFIKNRLALAESTIKGYKRAVKLTFGDIKNKSIFSVTPEQINQLHQKRSKTTKAKADHDMRVFRLLWNWGVNKYKKDCPEILSIPNPVGEALNSGHRAGVKGWNKVPRKQSIIPRKKLPQWFASLKIMRLRHSKSKTRESIAYLTEFLILTGLRFNEASSLPWNKVDLNKKILIIEDNTSKNRQELIKLITARAMEILEAQKGKGKMFVFPSLVDHIRDSRDFRARLIEESKIEFTNHDLRRVYLSAGSRAEVSGDILKRLVNHLS